MPLGIIAMTTSCRPSNPTSEDTTAVISSTTIVDDVVNTIAGGNVSTSSLLPPGADPHSFEPTPQDIARLEQAELIFINGRGLEKSLDNFLNNLDQSKIVSVSEKVHPRSLDTDTHENNHDHDTNPDHVAGANHDHAGIDPHVWFDPQNVMIWTDTIRDRLVELDPDNTELYKARATDYKAELKTLHEWITQEIESIPPEKRVLVTDHDALGYFADAYGFRIVDTVIPGFSTASEPSAQKLAELKNQIEQYGVSAVFVGTTTNQKIAQQLTEDADIKLVPLYTGSLSDPNEPAPTYIQFMRHNVTEIVDALQ